MTDPLKTGSKRLPPWLRKRMSANTDAPQVARMLEDLHLVTVCDGAHCPNRHECFSRGTATFMILGAACTRNCRFCAVEPAQSLAPPRDDEPAAVAEAAKRLGLRHVVITSVTRDDLPDGGAEHFARTIRSVRGQLPDTVIEVLVPDFLGSTDSIDIVLTARPHVFNHNVETVPRLYPTVRPQADYLRSLDVLRYVKEKEEELAEQARPLNEGRSVLTKSGLMVGLGEASGEVEQTMGDLRNVGCDILTIGQYLAPSKGHLPVVSYIEPEQFDAWRACGMEMGFAAVAAGPFVRSSYLAEDVFRNRRT